MKNKLVIPFIAALASLNSGHAAKAPLSKEKLREQSTHIVLGKVTKVTSKNSKSKQETSFGIHRDRVYQISIKITEVRKGEGVKADETIAVGAWRPAVRIPPLPGVQGHEDIPGKGDKVEVFMQLKNRSFTVIVPNGFRIVKE
ncbi:MAG: hypothetical protein QF437_22325 [Planctomycetota bacterium]|nr:hypothetical protein [Planctomycetota bacterium]MDP7133249.1 hypothetical protein [Planctomycetota bacterium]MDP7254624.1 hypothetical protein [Planctomycetota bacterium]